jgi:site-specific DNA-methyltransferase (adenine-specific)
MPFDIQANLNKIILADCLDIMREIPDKAIDLCLCDPPYGIGIDGQKENIKGKKSDRKYHESKGWDSNIPDKEVFDEMIRISKQQIVCGANYFNEYLPQGNKGWIVWDKGQHGLTMSDCEIIYSSSDKPTRVYTYNRAELIADNTFHPTQKPVKLFKRILQDNIEKGIVLDCFSGSGTTALACHDLGLDFICVEKDEDYYKASVERLEQHKRQLKLI